LAENSLKRHFTVKALKDCEILVLSKEVRIVFDLNEIRIYIKQLMNMRKRLMNYLKKQGKSD
jgi:hypothetical protein